MILEIYIAILIGTLCGIITGLIPGIHVNLVAAITMSALPALSFISPEFFIVFIISLSITHTFLDTIPSIFLGAPEPGIALSILPGHRLLLEGKGFEAVKLTIIGSTFGLIFSLILFYPITLLVDIIYPLAQNNMFYLLFAAGLFMIGNSPKPKQTFLLFSLAGILGYLTLNSGLENALFPLLSGLFGTATLIFSLNQKSVMPKQKFENKTNITLKKMIPSSLLGTISGFLTSMLPGLGASTAAALSSSVKKETETKDFLITVGAISTVNFFLSIATLAILDKARNGAILAIRNTVEGTNILLMIAAGTIAAGLAITLALKISKVFGKLMQKVNYELLIKIIIILLIIMTIILSGALGILILFIATTLGLYANHKGLPRNAMMACILVPVMIYFI